MSQENNFIISSTERTVAAEAAAVAKVDGVKASESVQNEQDEISAESDTTEIDQTEESEGSENEQDDESGDQEESKQDEKPKKKNGFKKRIDKLTKSRAEEAQKRTLAEQERDYWKEQYLKGKPSQEPQQKDEPKKVETQSDEPKEEEFDSYKDFVKAQVKWELAQEKKQSEAKDKESKLKSEYQKQVETFQSKVSEFSKTHEDFQEVLSEVDEIPLSVAVHELLLTSDSGPELIYELAKNKDEFARVNSLSPLAAARELGKIEARIAKAKESSNQTEKKQTNAPAPISTVGGKGSVSVAKSLSDPNLSFAEYERLRLKELKAKGA